MAKAKGSAAIVENAKNFVSGFRTFSTGQKAVVIAVVAALIGGAVLFSKWASTPSYAPMFSNLSGTDASAIVDKLDADGVPYELTANGSTISVPADVVDSERLAMAGAGLPAETDSSSGSTLLSQGGVTASEFVQQQAYQQDLRKTLATTIESIDGIQTAVVNLAMPEKDVFLDEQDPVTASVLVKLRPGKELSNDNVTSIVNLVAGGVPGMDPKNVSVVDDQGNTLSTDGSGSSAQNEKTSDYNASASSDLQTYLESIYGKGNVKATVKATLNYDDKTESSTIYSQPQKIDPLASSSTTEKYDGTTGAAATGVLGPDNIAVPSTGSTAGGGYSKEAATDNNAINKTDTVTKQAPGKLEKQTVSVVVNAGAKGAAGAADVNQITQIVNQAAGIDATRGDSVSVVKTAFDDTAATDAAAALAEAGKAEQQSTLVGYAKTAALALLVLIMLIVVLVAFRRRKVETVDVLDVEPLQLGDITGEELKEIAPLVEKPVALEAAPVDPALEAAAARRTEVVELVSRQPEEVAELLRGWLADRRS